MGDPFGLKGLVKVKSYSGETGHFLQLKKATLKKDGTEKSLDVDEVIPQGGGLLIRFAGIDTPEDARLLKGSEIIASRKYASPLNEGEYYIEDLKGLEAVALDGKALGEITNVIEGGGGFLAEIKLLSGEIKLAPFRKEFFGEVNFEENKITLFEPWILES